jgi:hypothetical protein
VRQLDNADSRMQCQEPGPVGTGRRQAPFPFECRNRLMVLESWWAATRCTASWRCRPLAPTDRQTDGRVARREGLLISV